jgi:ketosteroid isomerase-like protein
MAEHDGGHDSHAHGDPLAVVRRYLDAWEQGDAAIFEEVVQGDTVVVRTTGRHRHAASGRRVTVTGMIWVRVVDGTITTGWGEHDRLGQLQQLGVVPSGAEGQAWVRERLPQASDR